MDSLTDGVAARLPPVGIDGNLCSSWELVGERGKSQLPLKRPTGPILSAMTQLQPTRVLTGACPLLAFAICILCASAGYGQVPYDRSLYEHWTDDDADCQNTRAEVLISESMSPVELDENGCEVLKGRWFDPYTGLMVKDPSQLDVDHLVPLAEAHRSGAESWDADQRRAFANNLVHPDGLIAVFSKANRSKGDSDPANWLPPNESYRCEYVQDWLIYKFIWELSMDKEEELAIRRVLRECGTGNRISSPAAVKEPASRLVASRAGTVGCTDINTAGPSLLESISGIGPAKSRAIRGHIERNGPFLALDDVVSVSGIGRATLENIRAAGFCVKEGSPPDPATSAPAASEQARQARTISPQCTDINAVGSAGLRRVSGIGEKRAAAILEYRHRFGPFRSLNELTRVSGIGAATLRNVRQAGFCVP